MDDFDLFATEIDRECLHQDFDDVDLYGEKLEENESDGYGDDLILD